MEMDRKLVLFLKFTSVIEILLKLPVLHFVGGGDRP